ncbi:hypothetical protein, partial [Mycobacterium kiyosense]|uniref:hypothetical protein n=1 Tax=Mycobacterium kiyosense TaxID=2871094 RepID=UPI00285284ED
MAEIEREGLRGATGGARSRRWRPGAPGCRCATPKPWLPSPDKLNISMTPLTNKWKMNGSTGSKKVP